jgi:hypothetical protein
MLAMKKMPAIKMPAVRNAKFMTPPIIEKMTKTFELKL